MISNKKINAINKKILTARRTVASKWSKTKKINKKIPMVHRTVGSKWAKIQKGKQNKLKKLTIYIFTQF
jgi:hypothetical protein